MWPFLSAFIEQPPNPKPSSSSQEQATTTTAATASITVQDYDAPGFEPALKRKDTQQEQQHQQQQQQQQLQTTQIPARAPPPPPPPPPSSSPRTIPSRPPSSPDLLSPETTPKALVPSAAPIVEISAIPQISLLADDGICRDDSRVRGVNSHSDGEWVGGGGTDDDGIPPSFPSLNSAQRASGEISSLTISLSSSTPPPSSAARSRLAAVGLGASGVAAGSGLTLPNQRKSATSSSSSRKKVILEPGHSPLDWARLQRSGADLRGLPHSNLIQVSPSMLATHAKSPDDVWTALNGRVYNITLYLPFHPGGERDLLRGAGKDCTKLFNTTHPWVNVEGMLAECLIGIYITEEEAAVTAAPESSLESVD
ncbi:hypothetical protein C7212DRAFT_285412 [Tuber magnatum]|uniref:Cytochrome b5 heme-binding domain-containing protein n=1 Tax=Tuber magnatum TaxID=42249 RepID=A0A317SF49_9PEZI|nr:hypothetical protein C7212DRAFT_285412 [Tuber magnatum]